VWKTDCSDWLLAVAAPHSHFKAHSFIGTQYPQVHWYSVPTSSLVLNTHKFIGTQYPQVVGHREMR
jgi:hypothetical protein